MGSLALWRWRAQRTGHQAKALAWLGLAGARRRIGRARKWVADVAPLVLHFGCIVGGVVLGAESLAALTGRPDVVWPAAGSMFLLSAAGWGHLRTVASFGVYALSKKPRGDGGAS